MIIIVWLIHLFKLVPYYGINSCLRISLKPTEQGVASAAEAYSYEAETKTKPAIFRFIWTTVTCHGFSCFVSFLGAN